MTKSYLLSPIQEIKPLASESLSLHETKNFFSEKSMKNHEKVLFCLRHFFQRYVMDSHFWYDAGLTLSQTAGKRAVSCCLFVQELHLNWDRQPQFFPELLCLAMYLTDPGPDLLTQIPALTLVHLISMDLPGCWTVGWAGLLSWGSLCSPCSGSLSRFLPYLSCCCPWVPAWQGSPFFLLTEWGPTYVLLLYSLSVAVSKDIVLRRN